MTATAERKPRVADLPTASALAEARAAIEANEPASETERGIFEAMSRTLGLIEGDLEMIDSIEDRCALLWLHFDWLKAHHIRIRGLRSLADDIEATAAEAAAEAGS